MEFHPCGICGVHVLETDEAVQCDGQCSLWHHRECLGMTLADYLKLSRGQEDWFCSKCIVKQEIKQEAQAERRRQQRSEMGKSKIECKKLEVLSGDQKCVFCLRTDIDEMKYGPIYMHKNIITHYYCLLLSSNMEQNGRDSDGILGFLANDIQKEVKRGVRLYCTYCRRGGATLGCAIAKCKVVFHLPCGMKHGTLHQFFGEFKSYCAKHRPVQKISAKILAESSKNAMCGICYEKVVPRPIHETLWAPCCQKSAFFHRDCVQKLATSAGYFFKCPLCNNTSLFQKEMKEFGIYIPEQDASWECVPNAFQDLLVRHDTCNSVSCSCPRGRKFNNQGTRWELVLCKFCGSQGMHIGCGRLKWKSPEFVCDICSGNNETVEENTRNQGDRHRLTGPARTAEIHPSVSADRERVRSVDNERSDDNETSDESEKVIQTNRKGRRRIVSPIEKTEPDDTRMHKKSVKREKKSTLTSITKMEDISYSKSDTVVIDDSDDDIEVVEDTKGGICLKTNDGSTIPIIKVKDSTKKRLNIEGDVNVVPDEIVDICEKDGPPTKRYPSPHVEEVFFSLPSPVPKPSTSTFCPTPSSSFTAPLPETASSLGPFVIVDPSTFRPEDLPPGTVLYRSFAPMMPVPQTSIPPQPLPPTQVPTQYFSCDNSSWAGPMGVMQMPNIQISVNTGVGAASISTPQRTTQRKHPAKQHNSSRRRGRRRCDNDRLNPKVLLSPLKTRISERGFVEILLPRRNVGLGFGFASLKRKIGPLPSRPAVKISKTTVSKKKKKISIKKNASKPNSHDQKIKKFSKVEKAEQLKHKKQAIQNTKEKVNKSNTRHLEKNINEDCRTKINFFLPNSSVQIMKGEVSTSNCKIGKENSLQLKLKHKKKQKENKRSLIEWNGKKIDEYLDKKQVMQSDDFLVNTELCRKEGFTTVKELIDEIIGSVVEEHLSKLDITEIDNSDQSINSSENYSLVQSCDSTGTEITDQDLNNSIDAKAFLEFCNHLTKKTTSDSLSIAAPKIEIFDNNADNCGNIKEKDITLGNGKEIEATLDARTIDKSPSLTQVQDNIWDSRSNLATPIDPIESAMNKDLSHSDLLHGVEPVILEKNDLSNTRCSRKDNCAINRFPKIKFKFHGRTQRVLNLCGTNSKAMGKYESKINDFKTSIQDDFNTVLSKEGNTFDFDTLAKSKTKRSLTVTSLPKAKRRKEEKISPTSKQGTIQNYFMSVRKDHFNSPIKATSNMSSENDKNGGKENNCNSMPLVNSENLLQNLLPTTNFNSETNMETPVKPSDSPQSMPEKSPEKKPLGELGIFSTAISKANCLVL